jgi:superfamily I DNA and/or RNA helicase/very-short-patch-repair endonuclease
MSGTKSKPALASIVEGKIDLQSRISLSIEKQREYYTLHQELISLKDFDFTISDFNCFSNKFSENVWQSIKSLKQEIKNSKAILKSFEKENPEAEESLAFEGLQAFRGKKYSQLLTSMKQGFLDIWGNIEKLQEEIDQFTKDINTYSTQDEKVEFDKRFSVLNPREVDFTTSLVTIKKDIEGTAYDRHFKLFRKINNISRNLRLRDTIQKLPREVIDYINTFLAQDVSRTEAKRFIDSLCDYFDHYVKIRDLANKKIKILELLGAFCADHEKSFTPEIIHIIRACVYKQNVSNEEVGKCFNTLITYFSYYEKLDELTLAKTNLENTCESNLEVCGISHEEFISIEKLIEEHSLSVENVKTNILRVQNIKLELTKLAKVESVNSLSSQVKRSETERTKRIAGYLENIINQNIIRKWKTGITIKQIVQKLSKAFGKSKKAFKTFDSLRKDTNNFNAILDLIPIWIMELDDASRIIPLEAGIFDYVILDEASQCNVAYTLPVMFRAKKALFVGDSEQMRDNTIMFKSNKHFESLARMYQIPVERQIKAFGDTVQSVLSIAENRGFMAKTLHYHYRSPRELIGFSNEYFYKPNGKDLIPLNSNYIAYGDTNRVMLIHEITSDWSEEFSDKVNVAEGKAILELFEELRSDEKYKDKSIGILTFFNHQATFLRDLFEKAGHKEDRDNYKVSIIEGIQGDEKDIVIYSFVIRNADQKNKYTSLTGEGGDIQAAVNKGRVNVAFSRARSQVHCFVSIPPQDMPDKIWLKKYLEYIKENGEVSFFSTELKPFDSYFEEDFYNLMRAKLNKGYIIQNQVVSCGFKIDFVISNATSGGKIAIECDGPTHFRNEIDEAYGIHIQSDEERQRVLEAAGWRFCRIKYVDWISKEFDRNTVVETVIELLK